MNQTKETKNKDKRPARLEGEENILGNRVKALCEAKGLSYGKLAKRLDKSKTTIIGYVHGYRFPLMRDIETLAEELDTSVAYLIGETDIPGTAVTEETLDEMLKEGVWTINGKPATTEQILKILDHVRNKIKESDQDQSAENNSLDEKA